MFPSDFISDSKKPLSDRTNLLHLEESDHTKEKQIFETPSLKNSQENMKTNLPITSTAVCNTRMVRRSTRHSTYRSLCSSEMSKLSPKINPDLEDSFQNDISVMEANVTAIEANVDSSMLNAFSKGTKKKVEVNEMTMIHHHNAAIENDQNRKTETSSRRKSTRLEAIKASQKNYLIFQGQSPLSDTTKKRPCKNGNVSCKYS